MSTNISTTSEDGDARQRVSVPTTGHGELSSEEITSMPGEDASRELIEGSSRNDNTDQHIRPSNLSSTASNGQEDHFFKLKPIDRSRATSRTKAAKQGAVQQSLTRLPSCKMYKFSVYETAARFYVVGGDLTDDCFRVLKIDRTLGSGDLSLAEDGSVYTKKEINQLISTIDEGNKGNGGLKLRCTAWGLLGFIRFTGPWYMLLITKRSMVALVGGHYIYRIDGTELLPVNTHSTSRFKSDQHPEEARFLAILNNLDLSRSFYFSYSYDITHTLQYNLARAQKAYPEAGQEPQTRRFNDMFVWNHYLLQPALQSLNNVYDWFLPIIHGFVDQASTSSLSKEASRWVTEPLFQLYPFTDAWCI